MTKETGMVRRDRSIVVRGKHVKAVLVVNKTVKMVSSVAVFSILLTGTTY